MKTQDIVRLGLLLVLGGGVFYITRQQEEDAGQTAAATAKAEPVATIDFKFLNRTKVDSESSSKVEYPEDMKALDNQRISIVGFMAPYEEIDNMKKFMLLPNYVGCYFCAPPSFTQVLLVEQATKTKDKLPFIDDPIIVTGTLRLYSTESEHPAHKAEFVYALDDTEVKVYTGADAPKKPAAAQPPRKLGNAPAAQPTPAQNTAQPHKSFQPQFLVASVSDLRKLPMLKVMKFEGVPRAEVEKKMRERVAASLTAEQWKALEKALLALGFIEKGTDVQKTLTGLQLASVPGVYDAANDTVYYEADAQFSKPEVRVNMVKLLTEVLIAQNISFKQPSLLALEDSELALASLNRGDIEHTAKLYDQTVRLLGGGPSAPLKVPEGYPTPTAALQRLFETPKLLGQPYLEVNFPAKEFDKVNEAYSKPLKSTAAIAQGREVEGVQDVAWSNDLLGEAKPVHAGTLGQAILSIWSKAEVAGWAGDRFALWDVGAEGDAWLMETRWKDEAAAAKFFAAAQASAGVGAKDESADEKVFAGQANGRFHRVYQVGTKVFVASAGSSEKVDAIVTQFVSPAK